MILSSEDFNSLIKIENIFFSQKYLRIRNQQIRIDKKHIFKKYNYYFSAEIKIISVECFLSVGKLFFFA